MYSQTGVYGDGVSAVWHLQTFLLTQRPSLSLFCVRAHIVQAAVEYFVVFFGAASRRFAGSRLSALNAGKKAPTQLRHRR